MNEDIFFGELTLEANPIIISVCKRYLRQTGPVAYTFKRFPFYVIDTERLRYGPVLCKGLAFVGCERTSAKSERCYE